MTLIVVSGGNVDAALLRRMQDKSAGSTIVLLEGTGTPDEPASREHDILLTDPFAGLDARRARERAEFEIKASMLRDIGPEPIEPVWKRQRRHPTSPTRGRGPR